MVSHRQFDQLDVVTMWKLLKMETDHRLQIPSLYTPPHTELLQLRFCNFDDTIWSILNDRLCISRFIRIDQCLVSFP